MKNFFLISLILLFTTSANLFAENYPNTSIGIVDLNKILTESKAAIDATKQIAKIQENVELEIKESDEKIIAERSKLIEQQSVMAPEAFQLKVQDFEKKAQQYQIDRQEKLQNLDNIVQNTRFQILQEVEPILDEISSELGITVLLWKDSVILSAANMDITDLIIKELNSKFPKIEINLEN